MSVPTVEVAAELLASGAVVIVPTDTVYGLAAAIDQPEAIARIFALKGRPTDKALPVLGGSVDSLQSVAVLDERARSLAARFWPGPLTVVVHRREDFTADLGGPDDGSVAIRIPAHEMVRRLMHVTGPLAVTSANRSGDEPAGNAAEAAAIFPGIEVLDGGRCEGTPSTVLDVRAEPKILRAGEIGEQQLDL